MKKIKNLFKTIISFIVFQFNSLLNYYNWNRCILKARFLQWTSSNKFVYFCVVPFTKTTIGVISTLQRDSYNKHALKNGFKKLTHNELIKNSYYCTGNILTLK